MTDFSLNKCKWSTRWRHSWGLEQGVLKLPCNLTCWSIISVYQPLRITVDLLLRTCASRVSSCVYYRFILSLGGKQSRPQSAPNLLCQREPENIQLLVNSQKEKRPAACDPRRWFLVEGCLPPALTTAKSWLRTGPTRLPLLLCAFKQTFRRTWSSTTHKAAKPPSHLRLGMTFQDFSETVTQMWLKCFYPGLRRGGD